MFLDLFFNGNRRAAGRPSLSVSRLTLSVSKSDKSARTNRNVFQEVTHCDRKIEQILNMFQKETQ